VADATALKTDNEVGARSAFERARCWETVSEICVLGTNVKRENENVVNAVGGAVKLKFNAVSEKKKTINEIRWKRRKEKIRFGYPWPNEICDLSFLSVETKLK
jgi:hypothetical protein